MMSAAELLALARQGLTSHDARLVLADAIEESGWWDDRIRYALSNGDDREECLALLCWPGDTGERHARTIVEALTHPPEALDENGFMRRTTQAKKEGG